MFLYIYQGGDWYGRNANSTERLNVKQQTNFKRHNAEANEFRCNENILKTLIIG